MEHSTTDIATFLKDYGGHILALVALIQVWLIALWKRFIAKPKMSVYPTASIEIGFSNFGPTVALLGTLRADKGDIFVNTMRVRVVRLRDKAEHIFTWRAFRPNEIAVGPNQGIQLHIARGFLVTPKAPKQYHVFFASDSFSNEYQSQVQPLRDSWIAFVEQAIKQVDENLVNQISKVLEHPGASAELFSKFIDSGTATPLHKQLSNDFFWRAGDYKIMFTTENEGKHSITKEWSFTISQKDEADLRLNAITIIREICGLSVTYNFSHKEYPRTK